MCEVLNNDFAMKCIARCLRTETALYVFFFPLALQSLKDLGRLTYMRFLELLRHIVGLLGRVIRPSQGLYLHRTTQHRKTRTNIHALSGIRTHNPSNQPAKTHASDRTATVTGGSIFTFIYVQRAKNEVVLSAWALKIYVDQFYTPRRYFPLLQTYSETF
jgi:hypothetical protein